VRTRAIERQLKGVETLPGVEVQGVIGAGAADADEIEHG